MFKAKQVEIEAKYENIALLYKNEAEHLGFFAGDRIKIINPKTEMFITCVLKLIEQQVAKGSSKKIRLAPGEIGLLGKAIEKLGVYENERVHVLPAKKPKSLEYVKKKFQGYPFEEQELHEIVDDIVNNKYSEVETTYFVTACAVQDLSIKEITFLTKAMVGVGRQLDFKKNTHDIIVDKHCIGGIPGNRTTLVVLPIAVAAGLTMPKTSSRAITSPAGTADTMEVLTHVDLTLSQMHKVVAEVGGCLVWGGNLDLSPADDIIIQVEHPLEIDSEGQMIASILSKKKSVGSTHILLDIPIGSTAKVKTYQDALRLQDKFEKVAQALGMQVVVIITDGNAPIGKGIGPLYEALDVMKVLRNEEGSSVLREKSLIMAGLVLEMAEKSKKGEGYAKAKEILESGRALAAFEKIIKAQGAKKIPAFGKYKHVVKAKSEGVISAIDCRKISKLAFILGAPKDVSAGLILYKTIQDEVKKGEVLFEMYTNSSQKLDYGKAYVQDNVFFSTNPFS